MKDQQLEKNKANAIAFYKTAYEGNPRKAVDLYVGATYIQHNQYYWTFCLLSSKTLRN